MLPKRKLHFSAAVLHIALEIRALGNQQGNGLSRRDFIHISISAKLWFTWPCMGNLLNLIHNQAANTLPIWHWLIAGTSGNRQREVCHYVPPGCLFLEDLQYRKCYSLETRMTYWGLMAYISINEMVIIDSSDGVSAVKSLYMCYQNQRWQTANAIGFLESNLTQIWFRRNFVSSKCFENSV